MLPRRHQIAAQKTGNRLAIFLGDRGIEPEGVSTVSVPLPAKAHNGETVTEEPRVSHIAGEVPVATVDQANNAALPPVGDFQKHRAVAFVSILGADGDEAGRELDFAVFQVHCVAQIDDALIVRIGNRKRNINLSDDAFVGSRVAERLAIEHVLARSNFYANDARLELRDHQKREEKKPTPG